MHIIKTFPFSGVLAAKPPKHQKKEFLGGCAPKPPADFSPATGKKKQKIKILGPPQARKSCEREPHYRTTLRKSRKACYNRAAFSRRRVRRICGRSSITLAVGCLFIAGAGAEPIVNYPKLKPPGLSLALLATRRASETYGVLTDALYGEPYSDGIHVKRI